MWNVVDCCCVFSGPIQFSEFVMVFGAVLFGTLVSRWRIEMVLGATV